MKIFTYKPIILETLRNYTLNALISDSMSGLIVAIVALPLAIAFGIASGVTPESGIVTAIIAGFIISAFGGSKVQIGGPTGAFIIIVYSIIEEYGLDGLTIATLMAGILLILFGLLKLGNIIKYIPYPIIVGFTGGIALTIFTTQIKDLLGLNISHVPADFIQKWILYIQSMYTIDWLSATVGLLSILIIVWTPRFIKKVPGSLVSIVLMTLLVWCGKTFADINSIETIGDRFSISNSLPPIQIPSFDWAALKHLFTPAITIAVLGAIESLLSATVADGVIGEHHDSNTELIGQGAANLVAPLFGGIPATGAIARTMANINNGGRSPISGIIHAVVLLLILLFLMPLAEYIPMPTLAGVLVVVSYNMCGWRNFRALMKAPKSDVIVLLSTFFLTVIFDLNIAIQVGIVLSCLLFMKRVTESTEIRLLQDKIDPNSDTDVYIDNEELNIPKDIEVYEINGPYFFGAGNKFEDLMTSMKHRPKVRIIRMRKVPFIDSTGLHNLQSICEKSKKENITVVLSGVQPPVMEVLIQAGFHQLIGKENICTHINTALERANALITFNEQVK